ncbi:MAG: nuclear transport factor 2 family protein [Calditrichaceae bacterium]|nr:nuclear transport factor 2 family protein [Calditrichaceae bacterium]
MGYAQNAEELIINKEKAALDRWKAGDTFGFIEIAAEDITYFDPGLEKRVTGKQEFHDHLASFNGTFGFPRYELRNAQVQFYGDIGILTFNFVGFSNEGKENKWNATEVFRLIDNDWKIVSSHWSKTKH